ncbi:hypothetical protein ACROYT_G013670 [Oculina patagonica]
MAESIVSEVNKAKMRQMRNSINQEIEDSRELKIQDNSYSHAHALDISSFFGLTIYQVDVMPPKGKLSRKKATHEGHKTAVKHIAYDDHEQLDDLDENKHVSKLRQQRESLRAKDEEILSNVKEEIKQIL